MDDLSTLEWSTKPEGATKTQPYGVPSSASFAALRPTPPTSGRTSPLATAPARPSSKTQTSVNDSFSNLVSFSSTSTNKTLSLQEQHKKLLEQKAQQQAAKQRQLESHYSGGNEHFWDNLGSGRSTPALPTPASIALGAQLPAFTEGSNRNGTANDELPRATTEDEADILAAFKADAPVDSSSHFPKPFEQSKAPSDAGLRSSPTLSISGGERQGQDPQNFAILEDDDPFGLAELSKKNLGNSQERALHRDNEADDEDVLGLLGKPVSELAKPPKIADSSPASTKQTSSHPQDQAMAELLEMGFPPEKAQEALGSTESGTDVQQAVGWLLSKAHSESKQNTGRRRSGKEGPRQSRDPRIDRRSGSRPDTRQSEPFEPAWSSDRRQERHRPQPSTTASEQPGKDSTPKTSELGTAFLKTAGSFWKTSTKKVQQAVQDFNNSDSDSSQPKWMRDPGAARDGQGSDQDDDERATTRSRRKNSTNRKLDSVTDEALMLESDRARPPPRKPPRRQEAAFDSSADNSRDHSPAIPSRLRQELPAQPAFLRQQQQPHPKAQARLDPKAALNRQAIDDQASQAYVSSARRRKRVLNPPVSASEPDLLESASVPKHSSTSRPATTQPVELNRPSRSPPPIVVRAPAPSRTIPPISPLSLKASHADREAGNDQFKRGDYSAAHQSYTSSLRHLPSAHPITIILHTNRALTALKIGEPKTAVADSEAAIAVIGPSRGEAEGIELINGEPAKPMRDYFGKALMRKAEALEQMEKWKEAALVWKEAVEGGHGGATSIQGRLRCEKSAAPPQRQREKHSSAGKKPLTSAPARSSFSGLKGTTNGTSSAAAVTRLRAANAAADRADDEKFALADIVDAKLAAWKGTKADNLRALLGSLDTVLWPGAGWKKIGMAELVLPARVKVQYMKGIAKVHPDKVRFPFFMLLLTPEV